MNEQKINLANRENYEIHIKPEINQAFLTNFSSSIQDQASMRDNQEALVTMQEMSGPEKVSFVYNKLQEQIEHMDVLMENMLQKQEIDFLAAYRGHMLKVQKEIISLKKLLSEKEFEISRDKRISSLQRSLTWFRDEAMNLSKEYENKKQQNKSIVINSKLLEDQITFLENGLKNAKKESLLLKGQLEKQQTHTYKLLEIAKMFLRKKDSSQQQSHDLLRTLKLIEIDMNQDKKTLDKEGIITESYILHKKDNRSYTNAMSPIIKNGFEKPIAGSGIFDKTGVDVEWNSEQFMTMNSKSFLFSILEASGNTNCLNEIVEKIDEYYSQKTERYEIQIEKLKRQIQTQKQKSREFNLTQARNDHHSRLEEIFKDCVDQIKKDRNRSSQSSLTGLSSMHSARRLNERKRKNITSFRSEILQNGTLQSYSSGVSSPKSIQHQNLKPHEKRKIVESILQNDDVFAKIYDLLYSPEIARMRSNSHINQSQLTSQNKRYLSEVLDSISDPLSQTLSSGQINQNSNNTNINIFLTSQGNDLNSPASSTQFQHVDVKNGKLIPKASFIHKQKEVRKLIDETSDREDRSKIRIQQYHLYNPSEQTIKTPFQNSQSQQRTSRPFSSYNTTARTIQLKAYQHQNKNVVQAGFTKNDQRPKTNEVNKRTLLNRTLNADAFSSLKSSNNLI